MTDLTLYTKVSGLPDHIKEQVLDFIEFLQQKEAQINTIPNKRVPGKAKNLIAIKDNFDDPIDGFTPYML